MKLNPKIRELRKELRWNKNLITKQQTRIIELENLIKATRITFGREFFNYNIAIKNKISPREQKIIEMRFGLTDGVTHTLEEVARAFNITRSRIRQIECVGLSKLQF